MSTVSYGLKITKENHIFNRTFGVYRDAVSYLMDIVILHYDTLAAIKPTKKATAQQLRQQAMERMVHSTKTYTAVYPAFDLRFYKFPSYLRSAGFQMRHPGVLYLCRKYVQTSLRRIR